MYSDGCCATGLSNKSKLILQSSIPSVLLLRIVLQIIFGGIMLSVMIKYATEVYWSNMLLWYSYWAVIFDGFVFFFGAATDISRYLYCYLYYKNKALTETSLRQTEGVGFLERLKLMTNTTYDTEFLYLMYALDTLRDGLYVVASLQTPTSHIAFWICWYVQPWDIGYASIVGHTVGVPFVFIMITLTTIYVSWWSLVLSLFYITGYFFYHIFVYYRDSFWVYGSLDPAQNPAWAYLIIGIPLAQVLTYFILCAFIWVKNRLLLLLESTFQFNVYNTNPMIEVTQLLHNKLQLATSQSMIFLYSMFILFLSITPFDMGLQMIIHSIFLGLYVAISAINSFYTLFYVFRDPSHETSDITHIQYASITSMIAFSMIFLHTCAAFIEMMWEIGNPNVWYFFQMFGSGAICICIYMYQYLKWGVFLSGIDRRFVKEMSSVVLTDTYF